MQEQLFNEEYKKYLDEKFSTLHKRIDAVFGELQVQREEQKRITALEIEMSKRPTIGQLLAACATTFTLGIAVAGLLVRIFG